MSKKNNTRIVVETQQIPWVSLGVIAQATAAADAVLGVTERDFASASLLTNSVFWKVPYGVNNIEARFLSDANGENNLITVWAGRLNQAKTDCEMARVCSLDVESGTQVTDDSTYTVYADEIVITNNDWLKTVAAIQSANDSEMMARLTFDLVGYDVILFHGNTTFPGPVKVEVSGY